MVSIKEYNPFAPEIKAYPYPYYDWLRLSPGWKSALPPRSCCAA